MRPIHGLMTVLLLSAAVARADELAIIHATLVPAPHAAAIEDTTIEIRDGRIAAIAPGAASTIANVIDARGRVVTAGLWNAHVHFTNPALEQDAANVLRDMVLRYGFTSVLDTGSDTGGTARLIQAIEAGRLDGPRIFTASGSLVTTDGTPSYLPGIRLPEVHDPAQARSLVDAVLDLPADGIKIFSGSFISPTETRLMPPDVIRAVTEAAHARGAFVVAHPTNADGLKNAVDHGVDVLAHTAPQAGVLSAGIIENMVGNGVALIPTLKLWRWELARYGRGKPQIDAYEQTAVTQLAEYFAAGGDVWFGTDVGYMHDYDTAAEFELMAAAGMPCLRR
jgi:imidazolonepropionase-like amidohydrolase